MKRYQWARFGTIAVCVAAFHLLNERLVWWELLLLWLAFIAVYLGANLENNWEREGQ